jgi:hypothetical protein
MSAQTAAWSVAFDGRLQPGEPGLGAGPALADLPLSQAYRAPGGITLPCAGVVMQPRRPACMAARTSAPDGVARYSTARERGAGRG